MSINLPEIRVGEPLRYKSLVVFPLFSKTSGKVDYRLSESAMADKTLIVEEVDEAGSVPELLVENKGDVRVLLLEGEELIGAKQNRILNTSVLVAAHSKIKIPVSCVERGRWRSTSCYFRSGGSQPTSKLRHTLKKSVSESIKEKKGHRSDQNKVWKEVASVQCSFGFQSDTDAMFDVYDSFQDRIKEYGEKLGYVRGATGIAVAIKDKVVSLDLFDKPETCREVWERMLTGAALDAIEAGDTEIVASVINAEQLIVVAGEWSWEESEAVGEGTEFRASSNDGEHASALTLDATVVHGSVVAGGD